MVNGIETYTNRQTWEVDLHPDRACDGPLDMHFALEVDPRTLITFEDEVNRVGEEDRLTFEGNSYITNPEGRILAQAPKEEDHILYGEVDFSSLEECPAQKHFLRDRRPDLYPSL